MIGQKIKILQLFKILGLKTEKYRSAELYFVPKEGSTIYLYSSSTSRTPLDSYGLAELKYAFFSRTDRNTKKITALKPFSIDYLFKHVLLEGSTILLQYSSISCTKLESSWLGELKCAISAGYDVILKNKSIRKCKNDSAVNVPGHCSMGCQRDGYFSRRSSSSCAVFDSPRLGEQKYAISKR